MSSRSDVIPNTSSLAQRKRSSIKRFPPADSVVMDGRVHVGSSSITPSTNTSNGNYYPPNIRQSSPIALPHRSSSKTSQQIGRKPLAPTYQKLLDSSNTTDKKQDPCAQLPNGLIPLSMCGDGSVSSSKTPTRCKSYKDILLQTKPKASQMNDNHTLPNDHSTAQDPGTPVAYSTPVGGKRTGRRRRGRKNNSRNVKNQTSTSNAQSGTSSTIKRRSSVRKSVRSRHSSQPTITRSSSASSDGSIIDRPMLVNLFDLITDDHPQSLSTKMKKLNLSSINENKRQMIGKVRQTPKIKKPSVLKRSLIAERQLRKERRTSSEPPCAPDATELAETNEQQPSIMNEAQPNDQVKRVIFHYSFTDVIFSGCQSM